MRGLIDRLNEHFATWSFAFALASLGVWMTWFNYTWLGIRTRAPDWVLSHERLILCTELVLLMIGAAVTAYRSGLVASMARIEAQEP